MSDARRRDDEERPLLPLLTPALRHRWRIFLSTLLGGVIAVAAVIDRPALYVASASFYPSGSDASSGVASVAEQFGVSLPTDAQIRSAEFYVALLQSRSLMLGVVRDTFDLPERSDEPVAFLDLFEIEGGSARDREEDGLDLLDGMVSASLGARNTRIVSISAATEWPSVSLALASAFIEGVNEYNQRTRQGQAGAERRFVEGRLALASDELRAAEDRLERFLVTNRQWSNSPELAFEYERLQREVGLRQQVFTSLTQASEDVRIREVRDTPVIEMVDEPAVPAWPAPRGRLVFVLLGLIGGGFVGVLVTMTSRAMSGLRTAEDPQAMEFVQLLDEVKQEIRSPILWIRRSDGP